MRIAICDDCDKDREAVGGILRKEKPEWKITCFESGEDLLEAFEDGGLYDLIFLDIYMKWMDGMETARALRAKGLHTALVFLTTSSDFAVASYDVNALSYLLKPVEHIKMQELLRKFEENYRPKQICIGNRLYIVRDILYFESQDKKVNIYFKDNTHATLTAKLGDVEQQLVGGSFLRCHRSFIVHMDAVSRVDGGAFVLSTGARIPMRQQDIAKLTQQYFRYVIGKRGAQ